MNEPERTCEPPLAGRALPGGQPRGGANLEAASELMRNWRIVLVGLFGMMVSAASLPTYAIGSFVAPLRAEFHWSGPDVQAALIFSQGGCAIAGLVIGSFAARFGTRIVALVGIFGVSAGFACAALNPGSLALFYLAFAMVSVLGAGSVPVVWSRLMTGAFERQRGFALALALTGTGIAGTLVPSLLVWLISAFGWRSGFWMLASLPLVIALPVVIAWMPGKDASENEQPNAVLAHATGNASDPSFTLAQALRSYRWWILLVSVIVLYLGITGILTNVIPAMTSQGMVVGDAALVQSAYAAVLIFGRLGVGWLVDRFWAPAVAAFSLVPAAFGSFLLAGEPSFAEAVFAISLVGVAAGAELDLLAFLVARYFGLRSFGSIYGVLYAGVAATSAAGPFAFAALQQATDSYALCFQVASVLLALGGGMILFLGRYPSRPLPFQTRDSLLPLN